MIEPTMSSQKNRIRLDSLLAERGVFESRSRAAASVIAGEVLLGQQREKASKPGQLVSADVEIALLTPEHSFVSRGGVKLSNALAAFGIDPSGRRALDAGASTGGFTDCLLQRGAEAVFAVDVGYGELAWKLRSDDRVEVRERTNVRTLTREALPWPVDLVVCDVSFIGLAKVLPALIACAGDSYDIAAMIKPQFEVGRANLGKGGVVRDPALRRAALVAVGQAATASGAFVWGYASSGLPGPKGNQETFIHLRAERSPFHDGDVEALARKVEP